MGGPSWSQSCGWFLHQSHSGKAAPLCPHPLQFNTFYAICSENNWFMQGFCLLIFCVLVFGTAVFQGASGYPVPRGCKYIAGNTTEIQWFLEAFCCCEYLSAPKLFKWSFSTLMFPGNGRFDLAYLTLSVSMSCIGGGIRQKDTEMEAVVCVCSWSVFSQRRSCQQPQLNIHWCVWTQATPFFRRYNNHVFAFQCLSQRFSRLACINRCKLVVWCLCTNVDDHSYLAPQPIFSFSTLSLMGAAWILITNGN